MHGIVNFAVYENGSEYLGIAKVSLPDVSHKTITANGAGIAGDIEVPVVGQTNAMTCTIEFNDNPEAAYRLNTPGVHIIDLRVPHQELDAKSSELRIRGYKHILHVSPITLKGGEIAPATMQGVGIDFACLYRADYIDGKRVLLIDKTHGEYRGIDGKNIYDDVNKALGKPVTSRI